ncbi:class I SAM-dependent methyltransferase [Streptomyces griseoviridis]
MSTYEPAPQLQPQVREFYSTTITEADRLTTTADGRLELVRTQELLRRHLPPAPARVLDVGGGPGVHARWLSDDGYAVHLVDPIPRHVDQAAAQGLTAEVGDARALTSADTSADVVLVLGPLYHLTSRADRNRALAEAYRVLRPGGLLAAAAIGRYASLFEHTAFAHLHTGPFPESIATILRTQIHDGRRGFTTAYFHGADELCAEVSEAGFIDARVYGVEGPAWSALAAVERTSGQRVGPDSPLFQSALAAARMADAYPDLLAAASHLLAVGHRPL